MGDKARKSKKPSATKAELLLESSTFYVDECLGTTVADTLLNEPGWGIIKTYKDESLTSVEDVDWLPLMGNRGWIVLTKDKAIKKKEDEREKVVSCRVRQFTLSHGNISGHDMAQVFIANRLKMARLLLHHQHFPFIAAVGRSGVNLLCGGNPDDKR